MPDFIAFNEGRQQIEDTGWPATVTFALSTRSVGGVGGSTAFAAGDTHAGGFGEITGTGYTRKTQAEPAASGLGRKLFTVLQWLTGAATDWPANVRSIVAIDGGTSKLLCAWNLRTGAETGLTRDMSGSNTTLNVTPDYAPTNPA